MKFGVFDHMDDGGLPLFEQYENRLKLVEAYDKAGLYAYHLAEHHSTPLGQAPSPGIFLSSVAQRTNRLRFGPLVYLLPFYHPLRLLEEICMLDHLSNGRFQVGIGRGISPIEASFYGLGPTKLQRMYQEALAVLQLGLTVDELSFEGEFYQLHKVPMSLKPLQRPHPPLWYGIENPESVSWAASNSVNIVTLALAERTRTITDLYRAEWKSLRRDEQPLPLMGVSRHIVVAETDSEARSIANQAYPAWQRSFRFLPNKFTPDAKPSPVAARYPASFDALQASGNGIAGSPGTVRQYIKEQREQCGINYLICWIAFGDMSFRDALKSLRLFADEVIPAFAADEVAAPQAPAHRPSLQA